MILSSLIYWNLMSYGGLEVEKEDYTTPMESVHL